MKTKVKGPKHGNALEMTHGFESVVLSNAKMNLLILIHYQLLLIQNLLLTMNTITIIMMIIMMKNMMMKKMKKIRVKKILLVKAQLSQILRWLHSMLSVLY